MQSLEDVACDSEAQLEAYISKEEPFGNRQNFVRTSY